MLIQQRQLPLQQIMQTVVLITGIQDPGARLETQDIARGYHRILACDRQLRDRTQSVDPLGEGRRSIAPKRGWGLSHQCPLTRLLERLLNAFHRALLPHGCQGQTGARNLQRLPMTGKDPFS